MTTFKEIRGTTIESVSSDPTNPEVGQIWYNNTIGVLKGYQVSPGTFASGGNLSTAIFGQGGAGTQTAALNFGGSPGNGIISNVTQSYNGTSWSPVNSMGTARSDLGGIGTQTAALGFGGYITTNPAPTKTSILTESWNGTSWSPVGNLNTARYNPGGVGTQTAGLAFGGGGQGPTFPRLNTTESWNGTSWTNVPATLSTAKVALGSAGTQTAALGFGGYQDGSPLFSNVTQEYDGSTWTAGGNLNTARGGMGGFGTQTAAVGAGGYSAQPAVITTATELYDGTSWTTNPTGLATARKGQTGSVGTQSLGLVAGGYTFPVGGTATNITEEWNGPTLVTKKITTS